MYLIVVVAVLLSNPSNAFSLSAMSNRSLRNSMVSCKMSDGNNNSDFWEAQKNLAKSMTDTMDVQEGKIPEL